MPLIKMPSVEAAAETIARSFMDDPFFFYLLPVERLRLIWLKRFAATSISMVAGFQECYVTDEQTGGAMILVPPGHYPLPLVKIVPFLIRLIFTTLRCKVSPVKLIASMKVLLSMEKLHPKFDCWYVMQVGVNPEMQGKGLGGKLMHELVARAEQENMPIYLETANEKNFSFYRRYGFEFGQEIKYEGVPPLWQMLNNHTGRD
jgi:ribosomal protein S18 acetylase RimI-like enzyme